MSSINDSMSDTISLSFTNGASSDDSGISATTEDAAPQSSDTLLPSLTPEAPTSTTTSVTWQLDPSSSTFTPPSQPPPQQEPTAPSTTSTPSPSRFSTSTRTRPSPSVAASQEAASSQSEQGASQDQASDARASASSDLSSSGRTTTTFSSVESVFTTSEEEIVTSSSGTTYVLSTTTTRQGVLRTTTLSPTQFTMVPTSGMNTGSGDTEEASQTPNGKVSGGMDTGARVGLAVGIIAAILAIVVAVHYIMRHKRHARSVKFLRRSRASLSLKKDQFDWEVLEGATGGTSGEKDGRSFEKPRPSSFQAVLSNPVTALVPKGAAVRESTTPIWMKELGLSQPPASGSPRSRPAFARANTDSTLIAHGQQEALQFSLTAPSESGSAVQGVFDSRPSTANSGNHLHPLFVRTTGHLVSPSSAGSSHPSSSEHSPSLDTLTRAFPLPAGAGAALDPVSTASGVHAGHTGPEGSPRAYQFPPPRPISSNNPFRASMDGSSAHSVFRHSLNATSPSGSNPFELDFTTTEPNLEFDFSGAEASKASTQLPMLDTRRASIAAGTAIASMKREKMMSGFSYYNPTTPVTPFPRRGSHVSSVYLADHTTPTNGRRGSEPNTAPWQPLSTRQRATSGASGTSRRSISWADELQPTPTDNTARFSNIFDAYSGRAI